MMAMAAAIPMDQEHLVERLEEISIGGGAGGANANAGGSANPNSQSKDEDGATAADDPERYVKHYYLSTSFGVDQTNTKRKRSLSIR